MTILNPYAKQITVAALLASTSLVASAKDLSVVPAGSYADDPTHSYITFSYNHLGLSNPTLSFDEFSVDMNLDNADPTQSTVSVTIDANSIVAGSDIWKEHITAPDLFDTSAHPEITFASTSIEAAGDGAYKVMGDLSIKGTSVPVALNVAINAAMDHPMSGKPVIGLDASGSVLRSEFGMEKALPFVSDEIAINISTELVKAE